MLSGRSGPAVAENRLPVKTENILINRCDVAAVAVVDGGVDIVVVVGGGGGVDIVYCCCCCIFFVFVVALFKNLRTEIKINNKFERLY